MIIRLDNVRISFPHLFETSTFAGQDTGKYEATFLIPKGDPQLAKIDAAAKEVAIAKFGEKKALALLEQIKKTDDRYLLRDGDLQRDEYAGYMTIKAKSAIPPRVMGHNPKIELTKETFRNLIYSGCFVNGSIEIFAYDNMKSGVSASLRGVQFVKDGDAFAGGAPAKPEEFEDLSVGENDIEDLI